MARFNEILVGRYNRMVQKLLSMKGAATLVTLSDEAIVVVPLFYGAENRYLEGWDLFGAVLGAGAVALNQSGMRLRNPAGSNVLAVFAKIAFITSAVSSVACNQGTTSADLAVIAPLTAARFDARGRPQPTVIGSNQNNAVTVPSFGSEFAEPAMPANQAYDIIVQENQEIPLLPGDALQLRALTVNVGLVVSLMWRERFLEDSERA